MTFFTALAAWIGCLTEAIFSAPFPWFFHIRETIILLLCPITLWKYWKCEWKKRLYTLRRSEVSSEGETVTVSHISLHKSSATLCIQSQIDFQWRADMQHVFSSHVKSFKESQRWMVFPDAMFITTATTSLAAFLHSCTWCRFLSHGIFFKNFRIT